ncbi:unnamed protein product [Clonostachys rosea]|uniref:INO80 complex subunit B-like conserved region domain-containing protein n=1 Tax=Bionectria ochroleuca TaxID=29856 RepID=A0ABY6UR51_BIOOC|nr:unnamed protein product [Clonostachys rosea]
MGEPVESHAGEIEGGNAEGFAAEGGHLSGNGEKRVANLFKNLDEKEEDSDEEEELEKVELKDNTFEKEDSESEGDNSVQEKPRPHKLKKLLPKSSKAGPNSAKKIMVPEIAIEVPWISEDEGTDRYTMTKVRIARGMTDWRMGKDVATSLGLP